MAKYKQKETPTNDLWLYIYRIAGKLKAENITSSNYTRTKAKSVTENVCAPVFVHKMIDKFSNEIISELKTYEV